MISCTTDFFEEINHHSSLPLRQLSDEPHAYKRCIMLSEMQNFFFVCFFFLSLPSLSRYKLKFSPDKVDTMIVQAICECVCLLLLLL